MSALDAVATLAAWSATSEDDRGRALDELATSLGPDWARGRVAVGRCRLGELRHARHGAFVVVPGGWVRMGLGRDDLCAAAARRHR